MLDDITGIVQAVEQSNGDDTLKLMMAETEEMDPELPQCVCPKCLSDGVSFTLLQEDYLGRAFYLYRCLDCGTEFILLEDHINSCRRGIINCKQRIEFEKKKIATFEKMLT